MQVSRALLVAAALCAPAASLNVRGRDPVDTSALTHDDSPKMVTPLDDVASRSHVPTMIPRGTFAAQKFENKLSKLHGGAEHYVPAVVPEGTLSGIAPPAPKDPKTMPIEMPNMVPSGHFARVAEQMRSQKMSRLFGDDRSQKQGTCDVLSTLVEMGRFVYEAEYTATRGIEKAGEAVLQMHNIVCPHILQRFPDAAKCMPACTTMAERITKLSSPDFIGEVKTPKQKCEGKPGRKVNFALVAALTGPNMLFGTDFCDDVYSMPPKCDKTATGAATINKQGMTGAAEEDVPAMEKAAESAVLRKEHLAWAHHQIGPVEDEVDEDGTVDPPVNGTEVYAARNAKVQAQVEKEEAEEAARAADAADAEDDAVPPAASDKTPVE
jgi:hypothetical protein